MAKKNKRPRIAFDPEDPTIRKALDLVGEELDLAPGEVLNYGALKALILLLMGDQEVHDRLQPSRQLRFGKKLEKSDLIQELKRLLGED